MTRDDVRTSITLPPDLYEAINKISKNNGRSMNSEITRAVSQYIAQPAHNQTAEKNSDVITLLALLENAEVQEKIRAIIHAQK
ncbi:MAG: Arc family DNA-binding protein [Methanocorpusculum sp.]|nr:Arc family DNA-binding protein [Methanocorpusculum sp.]